GSEPGPATYAVTAPHDQMLDHSGSATEGVTEAPLTQPPPTEAALSPPAQEQQATESPLPPQAREQPPPPRHAGGTATHGASLPGRPAYELRRTRLPRRVAGRFALRQVRIAIAALVLAATVVAINSNHFYRQLKREELAQANAQLATAARLFRPPAQPALH